MNVIFGMGISAITEVLSACGRTGSMALNGHESTCFREFTVVFFYYLLLNVTDVVAV